MDISRGCMRYDQHSVDIAIERNRKRFSKEIDDVLSGDFHRHNALMVLDFTPEVLRNVGLENLPILFTQRHLRNCLHAKDPEGKKHWHGIKRETIERIGEYLNDPVLIMDSLDREDSVVIVTPEIDDDGLPIIASLAINGYGQYQFEKIDTNFMTSVYGHKALDAILSYAVAEEKILFVNEEKAHELGNLAKLTLLRGLPQLGLTGIIRTSDNIVNDTDVDRIYTLDEIYSRADGKPHLSPELKAKDEALWELAELIKEHEGSNPYDLASRSTIDSAEEYIDEWLSENKLHPGFNDRGSLVEMRAGDHNLDAVLLSILSDAGLCPVYAAPDVKAEAGSKDLQTEGDRSVPGPAAEEEEIDF